MLLHQTIYNLVVKQFLAMVVYIVPHQELTEREHAKYALLFHIPTLLTTKGIAKHGEDESNIHTMLILWQIFEHRHLYGEVLAKKFGKGNVEHDVLIASANVETASLIHHLNRQHEDWSIAWCLTKFSLIPTQRTNSEIEGVGTSLFYGITRSTIDILQRVLCLGLGMIGMQQSMAQVVGDKRLKRRIESGMYQSLAIIKANVNIGLLHNAELTSILKLIFQFVNIE